MTREVRQLIDKNRLKDVVTNIKEHIDAQPIEFVDIRAVLLTVIDIIDEQPVWLERIDKS